MFQNGLLATFIPEVLLVVAYIFCFFGHNINSEYTATEITPQIVQISTVGQAPISTFSVYNFDLHYTQQAVNAQQLFVHIVDIVNSFHETPFDILNSVSFVLFSRPPPLF